MRTVNQIIEAAGGCRAIEERVGLKPDSVKKWRGIGVPERHWPALIEAVPDLTPEELYQANRTVREGAAA